MFGAVLTNNFCKGRDPVMGFSRFLEPQKKLQILKSSVQSKRGHLSQCITKFGLEYKKCTAHLSSFSSAVSLLNPAVNDTFLSIAK